MNSLVQRARSWLFLPAMRPERLATALATCADVVVLDLEDAVAVAEKDEARRRLAQMLQCLPPAQRSR